tara:strand:- start:354 stop:596 length:243 start_codon:yes stop_codon:yes gene_type:complete
METIQYSQQLHQQLAAVVLQVIRHQIQAQLVDQVVVEEKQTNHLQVLVQLVTHLLLVHLKVILVVLAEIIQVVAVEVQVL